MIASTTPTAKDYAPMIILHHLNNSRSQRILWLLEELGLSYEIKRYQRDPRTLLAPPALKAIHPLGKAPILSDGDLTLAESGAILEYLVRRYGHGRLQPAPGSGDEIRYLYWMHYAEGSAMPLLVMNLIFQRIPQAPMPFFIKPIARLLMKGVQASYLAPQIETHLDYLEAELAHAPWFAGPEFTVADIQMSFVLEAAAARGGLQGRRPRLWAWLQAIHARPPYGRALQAGGPYEMSQ
jgi:glutathione S-transferase